MKRPSVLLFTHSLELLQYISSSLMEIIKVRRVNSIPELEKSCREFGPSIILLDMRTPEFQQRGASFIKSLSQNVVIALGSILSDAALDADANGIYAVEEIDCDRRRLLSLINRALDHLELRGQVDKLRFSEKHPQPQRMDKISSHDSFLPLRQISWAFRHSSNVDIMFERIVEGLATSFGVSRSGLFVKNRDSDIYRLKAGVCCLNDTYKLEYSKDDPLVRWFEIQAHLVARLTLDHIENSQDRHMIEQTLDQLGAEVVVPFYAHGSMIGWILMGHRATGMPFTPNDLEDISITVDHISSFLENALLYEEVALQKTLAETLLHSLPTGIIAIDPSGIIRWFSTSAQNILNVSPTIVLNQSVDVLSPKIADPLRKAIEEKAPLIPTTWTDSSNRILHLHVRRLGGDGKCLGAVAMIQDKTNEIILKEKQEQIERTTFWNELAASMSHEVHNPLVAIKTFAQLLPERYNDPEFRREFSLLVSKEVDRLNNIIDQLNNFAHPQQLNFYPIDILQPIKKGLEEALPPEQRGNIKIAATIENNLPPIFGDEQALASCFGHLIRNSLEALVHKRDAEIELSAKRGNGETQNNSVMITIKDNGRGIPSHLSDKIFSPFCTTKARGMGLGLPIVQRTVLDHNGRVHVESNGNGTCVSIVLPIIEESKHHETHTHRG